MTCVHINNKDKNKIYDKRRWFCMHRGNRMTKMNISKSPPPSLGSSNSSNIMTSLHPHSLTKKSITSKAHSSKNRDLRLILKTKKAKIPFVCMKAVVLSLAPLVASWRFFELQCLSAEACVLDGGNSKGEPSWCIDPWVAEVKAWGAGASESCTERTNNVKISQKITGQVHNPKSEKDWLQTCNISRFICLT